MSLISYPIDALFSYHYFKAVEPLKTFLDSGRLRLIGDSGAYSAYSLGQTITVHDFGRWASTWRDRFYWIAALDVIGDAKATLSNWLTLRDDHGINTVPTLHAGTNLTWMDYYAKQGVDFIGLGGGAGDPAAWRWVVHAFAHAKRHHPHMRFHGWGVTTYNATSALPWYSVDSSGTVSSAVRFASARVWNPDRSRMVNVKLNGTDIYRHATWLRRYYPGLDPSAVARSHRDNRRLIVQWLTSSTQSFAAWLQHRHNVSPPTWGINQALRPGTGPRVHMAESSMKSVRYMIDTTKETP